MSFATLAAKDRWGEGSYMQSHCCVVTAILLNMQSHILLDMHSHSRKATGTPRLINMQSRSRKATVMPRRRGVAASKT